MGSHRRSFRELHPLSRKEFDGLAYGWMHGWDRAWSVRRTYAPHRQQCLACVTITRYTCILDVTLDPPKRVDYYPNYEIHFY